MGSDFVAVNGVRNCHAEGVDSIVTATDLDGKASRRIFLAHETHTLWHNAVHSPAYSVGFHGHHCAIRITPLAGRVYNLIASESESGSKRLHQWLWHSPFEGQPARFERIGDKRFNLQVYRIKSPIRLCPAMLHTIYIPQGEAAVWQVEELEEDKAHIPYCYTNTDLSRFGEGQCLYQPMSLEECMEALERLDGYRAAQG